MPCKKIFYPVFLMLAVNAVFAQNIQTVSGTITNSKSQPLEYASVYILNADKSAITDEHGIYTLKNIGNGRYMISVSAVGYATVTKEIIVNNTSEQHINIQLPDGLKRLNDVVVTAEKKEESLQNIPVSITALPEEKVAAYRLWNTKQLTAIVPNLYSNNSGDERNVTSIRGITTTSYDPAVATYIDGVNQFSLDTYIANLSDIERIEVLRGPQGTLYGRNALGGVINIITKQPTNQASGFAEVNIGNYDQQRYSAGLRLPLIKNKLFFGASGMFDKRDGFYTNAFNNSSFDKQHGITGNYYIKYIPAAKWALTANFKHQNNINSGAFPLVNSSEEAFGNPFVLSQDAVADMHDNTLNASLKINYFGSAFNFTSVSAFQNNYRIYDAPLDGDFSPADAVTIKNDYGHKWNNVKVFTQELRFQSPAGSASALKWTGGAYFFHQYNPIKQATHFGKDAALVGSPDINFETISTGRGKNTGIALYGQITYSITDRLDLIGGLRYDYENKKLDVEGEYQKDGEEAIIIQPDTSAHTNFNAISPKLAISYALTTNSHFYITYSRGYRTGGLTQLSSDPSQPPLFPYKPEYSNNFEAGLKNTLFQDRFRINITGFFTHVTDAQVPTLILPDAITVTKNTGKLNSAGAELELEATPLKGLEASYTFGYTHATYKSLKISIYGNAVDLDGKNQIFTPDITSMFALQYSYELSKKTQFKVTARGEWMYLGRQYFDLSNFVYQSPYNLLNTRLGISVKQYGLYFWGRNLGNKKYIAYAYDFGAVHLADPKTYGITLSAKF